MVSVYFRKLPRSSGIATMGAELPRDLTSSEAPTTVGDQPVPKARRCEPRVDARRSQPTIHSAGTVNRACLPAWGRRGLLPTKLLTLVVSDSPNCWAREAHAGASASSFAPGNTGGRPKKRIVDSDDCLIMLVEARVPTATTPCTFQHPVPSSQVSVEGYPTSSGTTIAHRGANMSGLTAQRMCQVRRPNVLTASPTRTNPSLS